jgi:hypothetical protein
MEFIQRSWQAQPKIIKKTNLTHNENFPKENYVSCFKSGKEPKKGSFCLENIIFFILLALIFFSFIGISYSEINTCLRKILH